jgi:hypothetical protein
MITNSGDDDDDFIIANDELRLLLQRLREIMVFDFVFEFKFEFEFKLIICTVQLLL